jgi:cytochrome c-type biogenesis protein CcmH
MRLFGRSAPRARNTLPYRKAFRAQGALLRALLVAFLLFAGAARAQAIEPMPFANHAQELRFQHLTRELRCPMCQNETLADSNAPIARDLRNQIFRMMQQGRSDEDIKQYLVARYSRFVLYDPPLTPGTWLLWFGPLLILLGGAGVVLMAIRKRSRDGVAATEPSAGSESPDNGPTDTGDDW